VGDPRIDHLIRRVVIAQGLDQDLPPSIELTAEDAMRSVSFVQRAAAVLDRCPEMICRVLVFEALDSAAIRAGEQEADHHVVEASVDEIIDDRSQRWLPTELFKQAHLGDDPEAM